jgi:hypothetical protein
MLSLRSLQRDFANAVLTREGSALLPWLRDPQDEARIQLYALTVYGTLTKALEAVYPVMRRLVGQRCFDGLARRYIHDHPSHSGDLHDFGEVFADFIQGSPLAADFPYFPDVARLEWHYHRVFHAANHGPLDLCRLQQIDPVCYEQLSFSLTPACTLFTSLYPAHHIWQANQPGGNGGALLIQQEIYLLILRGLEGIEFIPLTPGDYAFLTALRSGQMLTTAIAHALANDPDFDSNHSLLQYVARGVLIDFIQKPAVTENR